MESLNLTFFSSALHSAHDLIHILSLLHPDTNWSRRLGSRMRPGCHLIVTNVSQSLPREKSPPGFHSVKVSDWCSLHSQSWCQWEQDRFTGPTPERSELWGMFLRRRDAV